MDFLNLQFIIHHQIIPHLVLLLEDFRLLQVVSHLVQDLLDFLLDFLQLLHLVDILTLHPFLNPMDHHRVILNHSYLQVLNHYLPMEFLSHPLLIHNQRLQLIT